MPQLLLIMYFQNGFKADTGGIGCIFLYLGRRQTGGDQQDHIRAKGPGFGDLPGIDDKILTEYRNISHHLGLDQVVQVTPKKFVIGQHGNTGSRFIICGHHGFHFQLLCFEPALTRTLAFELRYNTGAIGQQQVMHQRPGLYFPEKAFIFKPGHRAEFFKRFNFRFFVGNDFF